MKIKDKCVFLLLLKITKSENTLFFGDERLPSHSFQWQKMLNLIENTELMCGHSIHMS